MSEFVLTPLKYIVVDRISNGVGLPAEHENPEWPRYIRTTDIAGPRALRDDVWYSQPPALLKQAGVEPGDLLLTNAGTVGKAYLHTSDESAVFAGYLTRVRPNPLKADSRYVAYCCESQPYWDQINTGATRSTIDNFSSGKYQDLRIPIPPLGTQRRIADMLDTETARIDTLINQNDYTATLLTRRLESLRADLLWPSECRHAWAGDPLSAPASSVREMTRLQYVVPTRVAGGTPTSNSETYWTDDSDKGVAWYSIGDLRHGRMSGEPSRWVSEAGMKAAGLTVMPAGTVAYTMYASIGKTSTLQTDGVTNQAILSLVPCEELLSEYLFEWLIFIQPFAEARARANTQGNLNADQVARFCIRIPTIGKQRVIVDELASASAHVAAMQTKIVRQQELLRLRRQSLITAAVTGQIEV